MKKEGFKIAITTVVITLIVVSCVFMIATSLANSITDQFEIEDRIELPINEKLVEYSIDKGKLYYSTIPMPKKHEPKEYEVYVDGIHITTIVETKK